MPMPLDDPDNPLAAEIRQEMAAAYFAACHKMVDSLEVLEAFDRNVSGAVAPNSEEQQIKRRSELVDHAAERVFFVIIQRDAMRLPWYEEFFEDYGVSAEVRARVGRPRQS